MRFLPRPVHRAQAHFHLARDPRPKGWPHFSPGGCQAPLPAPPPQNRGLAAALDAGFHSGGWPSALRKEIEVSLAQRKTGYVSPYEIAELYADLGDKDYAFQWLNTAYQEHGHLLYGLRTDFPSLRYKIGKQIPINSMRG